MKISDYLNKHPHVPRSVTVGYPLLEGNILLATKKVRFGAGKVKGIGGKVDTGETIEDCIIREVCEETTLRISDFTHVATLDMYFPYEKSNFTESGTGYEYAWDQRVHAFLIQKWDGDPKETEEMAPEWFPLTSIPFDRMWSDNQYWLPRILAGEKLEGAFLFSPDYKIEDYYLKSQ